MLVFTQPLHHEQVVTQGQFQAKYSWLEFRVFLLNLLPYQGEKIQSTQLYLGGEHVIQRETRGSIFISNYTKV